MHNPYYEIFRFPGAFTFSLAGLIARYPMAMLTLGIVVMISETRENYALASLVATSCVISSAFLAPQISRFAERYGQSRVAMPTTLISVLSAIGLILASRLQAPVWVLFACTFPIGVMPSFGAFVRARWSKIFHESRYLHAAFAYESIVDETIFMTGPIIAINLSTLLFPEAGLGAAIILLFVGCVFFCLQKKTEPIPDPQSWKSKRSVIRLVSVRVLTLLLFAISAIFGTAEVTVVAFAEELGNKSLSVYPLVAYAFGSFISGIIYGASSISTKLSCQLIFSITLSALTTLPLLFISTLWQLILVLFVAGAACSPTIIIVMKLIEYLVPKEKLTEGLTWETTGMGLGLAAGIAVSGQIIDTYGAGKGFYVSVIAGFFAFLFLLFFHHTLEKKDEARIKH